MLCVEQEAHVPESAHGHELVAEKHGRVDVPELGVAALAELVRATQRLERVCREVARQVGLGPRGRGAPGDSRDAAAVFVGEEEREEVTREGGEEGRDKVWQRRRHVDEL